MSAGLKRGRITAQIGLTEGHKLPAKSEATKELNEKTDEKRLLLEKLCEKYGRLKKDESAFIISIKEEEKRRSALEATLKDVEKQRENKNSVLEMEREQSIIEQMAEKRKEDNERETIRRKHLEKKIYRSRETLEERKRQKELIEQKLQKLQSDIKSVEAENAVLKDAEESDQKDLESYLTRLASHVFESQKKLEEIHLGSSESKADLLSYEECLKEEKRRKRNIKQKIESHLRNKKTRTEANSMISPSETISEPNELDLELETKHREISEVEDKWLEWQNKLIQLENSLAEEDSAMEIRKFSRERLSTSIQLANMKQTPPIYARYLKTSSSPKTSNSTTSSKSKSLTVPTERKRLSTISEVSIRKEMEDSRSLLSTAESVFLSSEVDLPGLEDFQDYEEVNQVDKDRKSIIQRSEKMAEYSLKSDETRLKQKVELMRRDAERLDELSKRQKREVQVKSDEIHVYRERIDDVQRKSEELEKQREQRRRKLDEIRKQKEHRNLESLNGHYERKSLLEHERNSISTEKKNLEIQLNNVKHQVELMKAWRKSADKKVLDGIRSSISEWQQKILVCEEELTELDAALNEARYANKAMRNELAVVKPYEEEYKEYESLLAEEHRLDRQLKSAVRQRKAETLSGSGDIRIN